MTIAYRRTDKIIPADHVPGPKQGEWTYSHYAALPEDGNRYEIVDGVLYMAPPSPTGWHQIAAGRLYYYLTTYVTFAGLGEAYIAPFDVELAPHTVVQPDVVVLLNRSKEKFIVSRIKGTPDLVIEVLSPGNEAYDRWKKYKAYAQAGVEEYWIADPKARSIEVLALESNEYHSIGIFKNDELVISKVLPEFPVRVKQIFDY